MGGGTAGVTRRGRPLERQGRSLVSQGAPCQGQEYRFKVGLAYVDRLDVDAGGRKGLDYERERGAAALGEYRQAGELVSLLSSSN